MENIEGSKSNFDSLEKFEAAFSDKLVPLHVFIMHTKAVNGEGIEAMADKMISELSAPQAIKNLMRAKILKLAGEQQTDKEEVHSLVLAHDTITNEYIGITNIGHWHKDGTEHLHEPRKIGAVDNKEMAELLIAMTQTELEHGTEWNGERQEPVIIDSSSFEECMSKLEAAGIKDEFLKLYPATDSGATVVTAAVPTVQTMTPDRRKALVKRFGEKKIKALEDKLNHHDN